MRATRRQFLRRASLVLAAGGLPAGVVAAATAPSTQARVRGGRIAGTREHGAPTALFEERDLRAVNSYEAIFKALLVGHLGLDRGYAKRVVFPDSASLDPFTGLLRS